MAWLNSLTRLRLNHLQARAESAFRDGDLYRAEELNKKALHITQEIAGNGLSTATYHSNLASIYATQNRSTEAESHYRTALEITELALGKDHLDVTKPMYELADFLYNNAIKERIEVDDVTEPLSELSDLLYYNSMDEAENPTKSRCLTDAEALYIRAHEIELASRLTQAN